MHRTFLEQNKPMLFNDIFLTETLFPHLLEVQKTHEKRMDLLMEELLDWKILNPILNLLVRKSKREFHHFRKLL